MWMLLITLPLLKKNEVLPMMSVTARTVILVKTELLFSLTNESVMRWKHFSWLHLALAWRITTYWPKLVHQVFRPLLKSYFKTVNRNKPVNSSEAVHSEGKKGFVLYFKERTFSVSQGFLCCTSSNLDILISLNSDIYMIRAKLQSYHLYVCTVQLDYSAFWYSTILKAFILKVYYGDYLK